MHVFPVFVKARTLPEAWEESIVKLWCSGVFVETEYDQKSVDAPAVIIVENPMAEPRIHLKGVVASGSRGLFEYIKEVVEGIHDHLVEKMGYTYHERLFSYKTPCGNVVDQIEYVVKKLKQAPYSRRAQAITWQPWKDPGTEHPPCLQRLWFRVVDEKLVLHAHMRSNDALKAAFMNMCAFTELQARVAEQLGVNVGYYMHVADSYHIYESDWKWAEKFVEQIKRGDSKKYWRRTEELRKMSRV